MNIDISPEQFHEKLSRFMKQTHELDTWQKGFPFEDGIHDASDVNTRSFILVLGEIFEMNQ